MIAVIGAARLKARRRGVGAVLLMGLAPASGTAHA
jgi:hypothetical protein